MNDRENLQVQISFDNLPSFITLSNKVMRFAPVEAKDVGIFNIMIYLEDAGKARREYAVVVTVEKVAASY